MIQDVSLSVGDVADGFRLTRIVPLPGLRAEGRQFEHEATGGKLLHVAADDSENCFAVTFPTPPPDDTGVPHILEHCVLGGSEKYPVREPFFEMVKMSMATFINAMTSQAFTVYPIASNVKKDFFNLADVYMDAVFHPELTRRTFAREAHHLCLEDNSDLSSPLALSGIVYSEMKGAYSTPESLMWTVAGRGLFSDTPLGRDSGGDPDAIPGLTYEQFCEFHRTLYHPGQSQIFVYGDIPTEEILAFVNDRLAGFDRQAAAVPTPRQPRWTEPRQVTHPYPAGEGENLDGRTFLALNWIIGDALDPTTAVMWSALVRVLIGDDAAPLKKALIDSGLGEDLSFCGSHGMAYEQSFHIGIKGSEADRADAFETLVLETLEGVAAAGIPAGRIASAFQQMAYSELEVSSMYPLELLSRVNEAWPYGADPVSFLDLGEIMEQCRARCEADPTVLTEMIRSSLVDNPHRLRVTLHPDPAIQPRADAAFAETMAARRARMTDEEVAAVARDAAALEAAQGVPNSPEDLARLPQLSVSDLPEAPRCIPTTVDTAGGITVLHNDVFANGINYLQIDVDLTGLPEDLYATLPRYRDAVNKMGAAGQSFAEIAERKAACTGGLSCGIQALRHATDADRSLPSLRFGLRTLDREAGRALDLVGDVVFGTDGRDRDRLRDVLIQARAGYRTRLVNDGLGTARRRAASGLSARGAFDELLSGCGMLRRIEAMCDGFDADAEATMARIEAIRGFVANRNRWTVSFTGSDGVYRELCDRLQDWGGRMPEAPIGADTLPFTPTGPRREGLAAPMKVAHCAQVMPAPALGDPELPMLALGVYLASFEYCLPEIRFKGNAYGGGFGLSDAQGVGYFYSFRDPRLAETLAVFDGVRDFVHAAGWSQADVERAIIGSAKSIERPIRPGPATSGALTRYLRGDTDALRTARYRASLGGTVSAVKETLLRYLDGALPASSICVVSSRENLECANAALSDRALDISDILKS